MLACYPPGGDKVNPSSPPESQPLLRHRKSHNMLGKSIITKVLFALALAILIAWAGHTSALFMGSSQQPWIDDSTIHSHTYGDEKLTCATYGDHCHSPLTADHLHETPHLTSLLSISTESERTQSREAPRYSIPPRPIFLIERPPRPELVL